MKKIYTAILLLISAFTINAQQLIITPNDSAAITNVVTDGFEPYDVHLVLTNNTGTPASVTWGLKDYAAPTGWELKLCDNNNCYDLLLAPGPHVSLTIAAGDTMDMKAQFTSHCIADSGSMNVYAYVTGDSANSVVTLNYKATLGANCATGIKETESTLLKIYPNPVRSSFVVSGLKDAGNLSYVVYDIKGAVVNSEVKNSSPAQTEISIQNLPNGNYLLKVFDANKKAVGSARLSKVD